MKIELPDLFGAIEGGQIPKAPAKPKRSSTRFSWLIALARWLGISHG